MPEVKILVEGYAREEEEGEFASSTATLIRDGNLNIVVDPGMDRGALLAGLAREGLSNEQIDFVVLTHLHLDHILLAGIFGKAKIIDDSCLSSWDGRIKEHGGKIPGSSIEIISTPGHHRSHCALLVNTEEMGKVVVAGDVFWWYDTEEQKTNQESLLNHQDPFMQDWKKLQASRQKILGIADYIIPGHGKMFKPTK